MIQDALAIFASAQSGTTSVAHTDIIDTLAAGSAYVGSWFVFQITTAYTQTGTTSRVTVQLQTSDVSAFTDSDDVTLVASQAFTTANLAAGKFWATRIPAGVKRYVRAYNLVSGTDGGNAFTAGAWNSFLTPDIDLEINKRYMIQ